MFTKSNLGLQESTVMEGYFPLKSKRKELEDGSDDFSDFSLSSPATKIRRLDAELTPIIEEECEGPITFEDSLPHEQSFGIHSPGGIKIEKLPSEPINEERAIVLFNLTNTTPLLQSPSIFSVSINPNLISGFKNHGLWSSQSNSWRVTDNEATENNRSGSDDGSLAIVPWVPSQDSSEAGRTELPPETDNSDMMDAQELEEASMEIDDGYNIDLSNVNDVDGMSLSDQCHQWRQPHCLIPQPPPNSTTPPIVWYQ